MGATYSSDANKTYPCIHICTYRFNGIISHTLEKTDDGYLYIKDNLGMNFSSNTSDETLCDYVINEIKNTFTVFYIKANFVTVSELEYKDKNIEECRPVLMKLLSLLRSINGIEEYKH